MPGICQIPHEFDQRETPQIQLKTSVFARVKSFLLDVGWSSLKSALVYGLAAAVPQVGVSAMTAYSGYSWLKAGHDMYNIYKAWKSGTKNRAESLEEVASTTTDATTGNISDAVGSAIVSGLKNNGVIREIAKKTGVGENVYSQMLQGSVSSTTSAGLDELAKLSVKRAIGA